MSNIRQQGSVDLVTSHFRARQRFTRPVRILDEAPAGGFRGQSSKAAPVLTPSEPKRRGKTVGQGVKVAGQVLSSEDEGQALQTASTHVAVGTARASALGIKGRFGDRSGRWMGHVSPVRARRRLGQRVRHQKAAQTGRNRARGIRRAGQAVSRALTVAWAKTTTAVVAAVGALAGSSFAVVAIILSVVIVIMSFIPTVIMNIFINDDVSPVSFVVGDDYPWAHAVRNSDGSASTVYNTVNEETGYYFGNCTDFVFWRVNRDMGGYPGAWVYSREDLTPLGGNGRQWGKEGNLSGWETITDPSRALPGDVVSFEAGTLGHTSEFGHVAYVSAVDGEGRITTENYGGAQYYVETISPDDAKTQIAAGNLVIKRNPALAARIEAGVGSGNDVVTWALSQQGMPYGRGRGHGSTDCCWFVHNAYKNARGISLPLSYPGQPWATSKCEYAMYALATTYGGYYVPLAMAEPGDIIFMQDKGVSKESDNLTHVAIYLGNGQLIDAAEPSVGVRSLHYYRSTQIIEPMVVRVD